MNGQRHAIACDFTHEDLRGGVIVFEAVHREDVLGATGN
jgi:hypothetical protein